MPRRGRNATEDDHRDAETARRERGLRFWARGSAHWRAAAGTRSRRKEGLGARVGLIDRDVDCGKAHMRAGRAARGPREAVFVLAQQRAAAPDDRDGAGRRGSRGGPEGAEGERAGPGAVRGTPCCFRSPCARCSCGTTPAGGGAGELAVEVGARAPARVAA